MLVRVASHSFCLQPSLPSHSSFLSPAPFGFHPAYTYTVLLLLGERPSSSVLKEVQQFGAFLTLTLGKEVDCKALDSLGRGEVSRSST